MTTCSLLHIVINPSLVACTKTTNTEECHFSKIVSTKKSQIFFVSQKATNSCFSVGCSRVLLYTLNSTTSRPHVVVALTARRVVHVAAELVLQPRRCSSHLCLLAIRLNAYGSAELRKWISIVCVCVCVYVCMCVLPGWPGTPLWSVDPCTYHQYRHTSASPT